MSSAVDKAKVGCVSSTLLSRLRRMLYRKACHCKPSYGIQGHAEPAPRRCCSRSIVVTSVPTKLHTSHPMPGGGRPLDAADVFKSKKRATMLNAANGRAPAVAGAERNGACLIQLCTGSQQGAFLCLDVFHVPSTVMLLRRHRQGAACTCT